MQGPEGTGVSLQVVAVGDRFSQPWVGPGQEGHDRSKGADETRMLLMCVMMERLCGIFDYFHMMWSCLDMGWGACPCRYGSNPQDPGGVSQTQLCCHKPFILLFMILIYIIQ